MSSTKRPRAIKALNARIPADLHRRVDVYCAEHDLTMKQFVIEALESHLGVVNDAPEVKRSQDDGHVRVLMDLSPSQMGRMLGLDEDEVASVLGVPTPQLGHRDLWPPHVRRRWQDLAELALRLEETFEPESIATWLAAPNRDLRWQIPLELLREGRLDEVDSALEAIDSGVYV